MSEESEQVLVEDRVTSPGWVKEGRIEVPIRKQHSNSTGKDW